MLGRDASENGREKLRAVVMVSGGGTNLQAIIDGVKDGTITNTELVGVISNNRNAYALKRAEENGIPGLCVSPKDYETRAVFNEKLLDNMLIDEDYKKITQFLSELPIDFLLYQFTSDNPTAQQFKSLFIINFDSYITYKPLYDLILTSDEMLDIVITQVIPLCTETKERKII